MNQQQNLFRRISSLELSFQILFLYLFVIIAQTQFTIAHAQSSEQPVDIVFDLDWTLVNNTDEAMVKADPRNTFELEGKWYRFSDHVFEVLTELHLRSDVRISFFSGGPANRNIQVIDLIYERLRQDPRLRAVHPHKVLSFNNLRTVSTDPSLRFAQRYKKDLAPYFDLERTLLVDDTAAFALPGQERNLLWLGKTYNDRPQFNLAHLESADQAAYSAPSWEEWIRNQKKLLHVRDVIVKALNFSHSFSGTFVESYQRCCNQTAAAARCTDLIL